MLVCWDQAACAALSAERVWRGLLTGAPEVPHAPRQTRRPIGSKVCLDLHACVHACTLGDARVSEFFVLGFPRRKRWRSWGTRCRRCWPGARA